MKLAILAALSASLFLTASAIAQDDKDGDKSTPAPSPAFFKAQETVTQGGVTVDGNHIDYSAHAGTLIVHPKGWDDATEPQGNDKNKQAEAEMFYVAYFKNGANPEQRPITFLYNGGPGSSSVWLHMGAFGPRRVMTADNTHSPAAPYQLVNNDESLLDASDLVFIDAPGTGFSRIAGKDAEKAFYGIDPDAYAFADFISQFLAKYGRFNSPKYLFGESYGTPRSAVLVNELETERDIDFNGVILLSQILNFALSPDRPEFEPG
ncbi:MAG: S10 family serine carboxypeptidase-like protein, partial [Rhizomicrobium sp.]